MGHCTEGDIVPMCPTIDSIFGNIQIEENFTRISFFKVLFKVYSTDWLPHIFCLCLVHKNRLTSQFAFVLLYYYIVPMCPPLVPMCLRCGAQWDSWDKFFRRFSHQPCLQNNVLTDTQHGQHVRLFQNQLSLVVRLTFFEPGSDDWFLSKCAPISPTPSYFVIVKNMYVELETCP